MKVCSTCHIVKPLSNFWKDGRPGRCSKSRCIECSSDYNKAYRLKNKDRLNAKTREKYDLMQSREWHLKRKYGISFKEYQDLLKVQGGICAICGKPEPSHKTLDVDHDHETGKIRGILCTNCNRMIGYAHDSEERLGCAADYLSSRKSGRNLSEPT